MRSVIDDLTAPVDITHIPLPRETVRDIERRHGDHDQSDHGNWASGAGGATWASSSIGLAGGGTAEVGVTSNGGMRLSVGGGTVTLDDRTADKAGRMLYYAAGDDEGNDAMRIGQTESEATYGTGRSDDYATEYVGLTRTGEDSFELDLSRGDGSVPPETVATATLTGAETREIGSEMDRYGFASRVETDAGTFSAVPNGDGSIATAWPGGQETTLSGREAEGISEGIQSATGPMDDQGLMEDKFANRYPENPDGSLAVGRDDPVGSASVRVGGGTMTITGYGRYEEGGHVAIEAPHLDISLSLSAEDADSIGSALGFDEGAGGYAAERSAPTRRPERRGRSTRHLRLREVLG